MWPQEHRCVFHLLFQFHGAQITGEQSYKSTVGRSTTDAIELADEAGTVKHLSSRPHEYASRSFASREVAVLLLVESAPVLPHCLLLFKCFRSLTATLCLTAQISGEKAEQSINYIPLLSALSKNDDYLSERTSPNISEFLRLAPQRFFFISSTDRLNPSRQRSLRQRGERSDGSGDARGSGGAPTGRSKRRHHDGKGFNIQNTSRKWGLLLMSALTEAN